MEHMEDSIDIVKEVKYFTLDDFAEGTIEASPEQQERLDELTQRVGSGEFHVKTDGKLPAGCVDGRPGGKLRPNAAGGTETIFVADDLTTQRLATEDGTTVGGYRNTLKLLKEEGYENEIGGHTDDHAHDDASGCGANDKLSPIYEFIARKADSLRGLTESIGTAVDDVANKLIKDRATVRTSFSKGSELLEALKKEAPDNAVDPLEGKHKEVLAIINKRVGTTLDREAVAAEFPGYQVFNVDAWSFEDAARVTSLTQQEIDQKVAAMTYYNLATTGVLGGPGLRVAVLD